MQVGSKVHEADLSLSKYTTARQLDEDDMGPEGNAYSHSTKRRRWREVVSGRLRGEREESCNLRLHAVGPRLEAVTQKCSAQAPCSQRGTAISSYCSSSTRGRSCPAAAGAVLLLLGAEQQAE